MYCDIQDKLTQQLCSTMQGIEFSAELYDFISSDMSRLYPQLMSQTRMTLYDVAPNILGTFDSQLSEYAHKKFSRKGIQIKTSEWPAF
jgi:NADH dehydrogenase FAD-containing subunit